MHALSPFRSFRSLVVLVVVVAFPMGVLAGCAEEKNPEFNEKWEVGDCVKVGGNKDIDVADCGASDSAGEIVKVIGPLSTASCPEGTRALDETMISGNGSLRQEMQICVD